MREVMGQLGQPCFTAFAKNMESWKETKTVVLCSSYKAHALSKSAIAVCGVPGTL